MKKHVFLSALVATAILANSAQADSPRLISSDGSNLTEFCIAAANNPGQLRALSANYGIPTAELSTVHCNGMPISRFADKYASKQLIDFAPRFTFNKNDESALTELCMAALTSKESYEQLKLRKFNGDHSLDQELQCNGMRLSTFLRRYRNNTAFSAAVR